MVIHLGNLADPLEEYRLNGVIHYLNSVCHSKGISVNIEYSHMKEGKYSGEFLMNYEKSEDVDEFVKLLNSLDYKSVEFGDCDVEKY